MSHQLAAFTAFLVLGTVSASLPARAADSVDEAIAVLDRLDETVVSVAWRGAPLAQVIDEIGALSPVPVRADWGALDRLGVGPRDEIVLTMDDAALGMVAAGVAIQVGDEFERPCLEVYAGQVVLTTREATSAMRLTDVYDVRDLLAHEGALDRLRAQAPPIPATSDPPPSGEADAEDDDDDEDDPGAVTDPGAIELHPDLRDLPPPPPRTPGEELVALIAEHVDPDSWIEFGGALASVSERHGVVFVTAPPSIHRRLREALRGLRRAYPSAVTVEAAIVDVSRAEYERLARRWEPGNAGLGRSLLGARGSSILWQTTAAAAFDEVLMTESSAGGVAVKIEIRPRLERATGLLRLEVAASSRHDGDERQVSTAVTIPFRQGGAVFELPAAVRGEEMRLLVLLPRRR